MAGLNVGDIVRINGKHKDVTIWISDMDRTINRIGVIESYKVNNPTVNIGDIDFYYPQKALDIVTLPEDTNNIKIYIQGRKVIVINKESPLFGMVGIVNHLIMPDYKQTLLNVRKGVIVQVNIATIINRGQSRCLFLWNEITEF